MVWAGVVGAVLMAVLLGLTSVMAAKGGLTMGILALIFIAAPVAIAFACGLVGAWGKQVSGSKGYMPGALAAILAAAVSYPVALWVATRPTFQSAVVQLSQGGNTAISIKLNFGVGPFLVNLMVWAAIGSLGGLLARKMSMGQVTGP